MSVIFGICLTAPDRKSRVARLKKKNVPVISVIDDLISIYTPFPQILSNQLIY